jgi:hypothetical protein
MYVMHVCMHACDACMGCMHAYVHVRAARVCMCGMYGRMFACLHACVRMRVCMCGMYGRMSACMHPYASMYECLCVSMYVCMRAFFFSNISCH